MPRPTVVFWHSRDCETLRLRPIKRISDGSGKCLENQWEASWQYALRNHACARQIGDDQPSGNPAFSSGQSQ